MIQTIRQAFATTLIVAFTLLVCVESFARDKPLVPNTNVHVIEIDRDWVLLAIDIQASKNSTEEIERFQRKILTQSVYSSELLDTAEFACNLYKRAAVYLSSSFDTENGLIYRISYLFGCAIP